MMEYVGEELDLFVHATNWKRYFGSFLKPYVRGHVLDVGCGMGVNAPFLINDTVRSYTFLEPDGKLLSMVEEPVGHLHLQRCERVQGTTSDLQGKKFDTILYLDVIEHIKHSSAELKSARTLLNPGGHLLILVPAFNFLYSDFDRAIGHYRRYDRDTLSNEIPKDLQRIHLKYFDSIGMLLSLGNRLFLKQSIPKLDQILFWDRRIIPITKVADKMLLHSFGRSLVAVYHKRS